MPPKRSHYCLEPLCNSPKKKKKTCRPQDHRSEGVVSQEESSGTCEGSENVDDQRPGTSREADRVDERFHSTIKDDKEALVELARRNALLEKNTRELHAKNKTLQELLEEAEKGKYAFDEEPCVEAIVHPWPVISNPGPAIASVSRALEEKNEALLKAVNEGSLMAVFNLLMEGADVSYKDENNYTALHIAASRGFVEIALALIIRGAPMNARDFQHWPALHYAAANGNTEVLLALIKAGAEVDARDDENTTSVMYSAIYGQRKCMEALLAAGAAINAQNSFGNTTLHFAASDGCYRCVRALLEAGADAALRNKYGKTAKDYATKSNIRSLFP